MIEVGVGSEDRLGEVHVDTAEVVDHISEAVEVQLHEVLDGDAEILLYGSHHLGDAFDQPGVHLVGAGTTGIRDEQVTGDGEQGQSVMCRVGMEDHDHVAVDTVHALRAQAVSKVLFSQSAARGGAHHQDVLRAGLLAGRKSPT